MTATQMPTVLYHMILVTTLAFANLVFRKSNIPAQVSKHTAKCKDEKGV